MQNIQFKSLKVLQYYFTVPHLKVIEIQRDSNLKAKFIVTLINFLEPIFG
jgi:hypothetical protein